MRKVSSGAGADRPSAGVRPAPWRAGSRPWTRVAGVVALALLSGCVTTTNDEARVEFSEKMRQYGTNPFIEAPIMKDLEKRIRAIAIQSEDAAGPYVFDDRNLQILRNFSDRYDHAKLMRDMSLARQGFAAAARAYYPIVGAQLGCRIDAADARFPRDAKNRTPARFDWTFVTGACRNGVAHGVGEARAGRTRFIGDFDNGQMVRGVFETVNSNGERISVIGDVPAVDYIGRALISAFRKNGFQWHRLADFDGQSRLNGFAINIWGYTDGMIVRAAGGFKDGNMHGFAASQLKRPWGDGKIWNTWIGVAENGKFNGPAAWTNNADTVRVAEYRNGSQNGVGYTQYNDPVGDYHMFDAGNFANGRREGMFKVFHSNNFNSGEHVWERYSNGDMVDASYNQNAFTLGQVLAFSMGAAIISAADAPSAAKLQIGTALAQDTLGGGGGTNLAALQQTFAQRANQTAGGGSNAAPAAATGGGSGITVDNVTITCPQTGVSKAIPVPYRTRACRRAAIDFATTYACNKLDQERVMRNCTAACGNSQCLQQ